MSAQRDWKKDVAKAAFVALPMLAPLVAGAKIDYEGEWVYNGRLDRHGTARWTDGWICASTDRPTNRPSSNPNPTTKPQQPNPNNPPPGVGYLGGSDKIDLNNANVRVYARFPGMYPSAAGKIVSHGPYKSVSDLYNIPGLTGA
jgi:hypothetical protein